MNTRIKLVHLILVLFAFTLALLPKAGHAMPVSSTQAQGSAPEKIKVGIYVLSMESLDLRTGILKAKIYLSFKCQKKCDFGNFRLANGAYTVLNKTEKQAGEAWQTIYNLNVDVQRELDVFDFPFDSYSLFFQVESVDHPESQLVFVLDDTTTGIAPGLNLTGWNVAKSIFPPTVITDENHVFGAPLSAYVYSVDVARPILYGVMKALLPATIIMLGSLLVYLFRYQNADRSIPIITGALLASVLFNINLTSVLPATGVLTFADVFMIINYIVLTVTLLVLIAVYVFTEQGKTETARKLMLGARWIVPPVWLVLQLFWLWFMINYDALFSRMA